jgi:hypothetical protein
VRYCHLLAYTGALCLATLASASTFASCVLSLALTIRAATTSLVAAGRCLLSALAFTFSLATLALTYARAVSMVSAASAVSVLAESFITHAAVNEQ